MRWAAWMGVFLAGGCATTRSPGSGAGGLSRPATLVGVPPTDWDDAFHKLVAACPDEASGPVIDFDTAVQVGFTVLSVAVGAYLVSQRPVDATTISIGILGAAAAIGVMAGLVMKIVSRIRGNTEGRRIKDTFLAAWAHAERLDRPALVQKVAVQCNEEDVAAAYADALGLP